MNRTAVFHVSTNSKNNLLKNKQTLAFALVFFPQDVNLKMKAIPINYYYFYFCDMYHFFVPCKGIQDSLGSWIPRHRFLIPGPRFRILCQWNLDSGFQSLVGFRIPWAVFRIPKPRFASTRKISRIPESGFPYMGWILGALNVHSRDCTEKQQIYVSHTHKSA